MPIGEFCAKDVVTALGEETIFDAAKKMGSKQVGAIVVVDSKKRPIGMITDRDITVRVVAQGKDPKSTLLREIISSDLMMLNQERGLFETARVMCEQGVRMVPVIDREGKLVGIICLDDLMVIFGEEMASLSGAIAYGASHVYGRRAAAG